MTLCSNIPGWNPVCGSKFSVTLPGTSILSFPAWFTCLPHSSSGPGPGVSQAGSRAQGTNAIDVQITRPESGLRAFAHQMCGFWLFCFDNIHSEYGWRNHYILYTYRSGETGHCLLFHDAFFCCLFTFYGIFFLNPPFLLYCSCLIFSQSLLACFVPANLFIK